MTAEPSDSKRKIRSLQSDDPRPMSAPRRYRNQSGYVRLRWAVAGGSVEIYEHRFVAEQMIGRPIRTDEHVHHKNHVKDDNRPENLEVVTHAEHGLRHRAVDDELISQLYRSGLSQPAIASIIGHDSAVVSRSLARSGTPCIQGERNRRKVDLDEVRRLHSLGWRAKRIAKHLGVGDYIIHARFRELGLPAFRPGRPEKVAS